MENTRQSDGARELGTGGPRVMPIGLGCMGMSWIYAESGRDDAESVRVIREALDSGVGLLDTAALYGDGHNERLVGRAVAGRRDDVVVATKGGLVVDDLATKSIHRDGRPESLRRHVEGSLERLGVERIDLYYLHRVDPNVPLEESWGALAELVAEGKLARIGLSEVTVAQTAAAHAVHPVAAIQSELSVWTRDPLGGQTRTDAEESLLEWTLANGVAFVPFAPLGRGYLTGTLAPGTFESGDIRSVNPRFTAEAFERNRLIGEEIGRRRLKSPSPGCWAWPTTSSRSPEPAAAGTLPRIWGPSAFGCPTPNASALTGSLRRTARDTDPCGRRHRGALQAILECPHPTGTVPTDKVFCLQGLFEDSLRQCQDRPASTRC